MKAKIEAAIIVAARITETHIIAVLQDDREISTPISWYPVLLAATETQRNRVEISPFGLHWPDLDEDLSVNGMLRGKPRPQSRRA